MAQDPLERIVILVLLVFAWWGVPISLLLLGRIPTRIQLFDIRYNSLVPIVPNMLLLLWLQNTIVPIYPGAGFLAGLIGVFRGDMPVSFLLGFLPYFLEGGLFGLAGFAGVSQLTMGAVSPAEVLRLITEAGSLFGGAVGLGLMGLGGSLYNIWSNRPEVQGVRMARLSALAFFAGLAIWFISIWVWPGWNPGP